MRNKRLPSDVDRDHLEVRAKHVFRSLDDPFAVAVLATPVR